MHQSRVAYAHWVGDCSQDLGFGSHGRGCTGRQGLPMGLEGRLGGLSVLLLLCMDGRVGLRYCDGVNGPKAQYAVECLTEVQSASGNMPCLLRKADADHSSAFVIVCSQYRLSSRGQCHKLMGPSILS